MAVSCRNKQSSCFVEAAKHNCKMVQISVQYGLFCTPICTILQRDLTDIRTH